MGLLDIALLALSLVLGVVGAYLYLSRIKISSEINTSHLEALWQVEKLILSTLNFDEVAEKVTNTILTELGYLKLGYEVVVLALVDSEKGVLRRVAISHTQGGRKFVSTTPIPFQSIEISLHENSNIAIQSLKENSIKFTRNVSDVLYPALDKFFVEKLQKELGIKATMVVPISVNNYGLGVLIYSMSKNESEISKNERMIIQSFTQAVGVSIQNATLFTSLRATSAQLQKANVRLKELDKMKDDFVSIASHELRTPMTAIKSYLWMAIKRSDVKLTEKMTRYLSRAYISTERLINLVNDMLNVSRIEAGRIEIKPTSFDMLFLVDDVIAEVAAKASEKMIHLQVFKTQLPSVFADSDKVHQVLLNLIGNALKFTPTDGTITVSFFSDGKVLEVSVKDSGVGINKDDLTKLFKKFERLDNAYVAAATSGGTGLGLYISKSLIDLMGGKIWAVSEGTNKGATFTFSLPLATKEIVAQAEKFTKKVEGEVKQLEPVAI